MKLDGVFLDMYGTLTTGDRQAVEATCEHLVRDYRLTLSAHELSITWGERFFHALDFCNGDGFLTLFDVECRTLRETMAALGVTMDPAPYAEMLRRYWSDPPLQPEASEFLKACPLPVCLVSNADRADIDAVIERHALKLDHVVTSEDACSYKPDRAIFELALAQTGWLRDRVIHVGDSLHSDVGGALVAGLHSGWINRAHRIHDIGTHTPDHEFGDLTEFGRWLNQGA